MCRNIHQFDRVHICLAPHISFKKNQTSGADVKFEGTVPSEDSYRMQILLLMKAILPTEFKIHTQMSERSTTIIISNQENERVVIEIVAHEQDGPEEREGSVIGHIKRCTTENSNISSIRSLGISSFSHSHSLTNDSFAGNQFSTRRPDERKKGRGCVWSKNDEVKVIHVWHDKNRTKAKITERMGPTTFKTTSINLN